MMLCFRGETHSSFFFQFLKLSLSRCNLAKLAFVNTTLSIKAITPYS